MEKFGSGEYSPTPSRSLVAFVNGKPTGYTCLVCGHMQKELDPIFDDLCLYCLREWALKQGVSRIIPMVEALEHEKALEPTKIHKNISEATTVILRKKIK